MNATRFFSRALAGLLVTSAFALGGCAYRQINADGSRTEYGFGSIGSDPSSRVIVYDRWDYRVPRTYYGPGVAVPMQPGVAVPRLHEPPVYCRPDNPYAGDPRRCRR